MKRLIGAFLIAFILTAPMAAQAQAADEAGSKRLELSRRFIALMQTDQMSTMIGQMTTTMMPPTEGLTDEQNGAIRRAMMAASERMIPRLFDAMAPIYADIFTLEELTGLVAFYESDIGRSMITKSYEAAPRVTAVVMEMMPEMVGGMVDSMCKELSCTAEQRAQIDAGVNAAGYGGKPAEGD